MPIYTSNTISEVNIVHITPLHLFESCSNFRDQDYTYKKYDALS